MTEIVDRLEDLLGTLPTEVRFSGCDIVQVGDAVLRMGVRYGVGTDVSATGLVGELVAARRIPILGGGRTRTSFVHVEDATRAILEALDHDLSGLYDVVDDEPAPMASWLPVLARELSAPMPRRARRVDEDVTRRLSWIGAERAASAAAFSAATGWRPAWRSWRVGFATELHELPFAAGS